MNKEFIAWAAGFFDGEGSIQIITSYPKKNGKAYPNNSLRLSLGQTDLYPLELFRENFGGAISARRPHTNPKYKKVWEWYSGGSKKSSEILTILLPYLIVKKRQAEIGLEFYSKVGRPGRNNKDGSIIPSYQLNSYKEQLSYVKRY